VWDGRELVALGRVGVFKDQLVGLIFVITKVFIIVPLATTALNPHAVFEYLGGVMGRFQVLSSALFPQILVRYVMSLAPFSYVDPWRRLSKSFISCSFFAIASFERIACGAHIDV
jgi:hypothetical protein